MLNLVRPRYVMPVHGDHKRIRLHAAARRRGRDRPRRTCSSGENGLPLEIDARGARFGEPEQAGMIFVDGVDIGDPADVALRDRRMLSADGIFIVVATVSEQSGESVVAARGDLPRRAVHRAGRRARRRHPRRGRALAGARRRTTASRDRPAPAGAARRPGGVRLRPVAAPADGAAGRRRGLTGSPRRAVGAPSARVPSSPVSSAITNAASPRCRDRRRRARQRSRTVPPCDSADRAARSPSAERRAAASRRRPPRTNRSNTRCASSGGIPGPSSSTRSATLIAVAPCARVDRASRAACDGPRSPSG